MQDDPEKIANVSLFQRDQQDRKIHQMREALIDIRELVEEHADADDGQPNTAMKVLMVVELALAPMIMLHEDRRRRR